MNETSFTTFSKREQILELFGKQILLSGARDKGSLRVFIENYEVMIPKLVKILEIRPNTKTNYTFFKLVNLLGQDGLKYIDLEKFPLEPDLIPEVQLFMFKYVSSLGNNTANIYEKSFKEIEESIRRKKVNKVAIEKIRKNVIFQKNIVKQSTLDKKSKMHLEKLISDHNDTIKRITKNTI